MGWVGAVCICGVCGYEWRPLWPCGGPHEKCVGRYASYCHCRLLYSCNAALVMLDAIDLEWRPLFRTFMMVLLVLYILDRYRSDKSHRRQHITSSLAVQTCLGVI